jgi:2-oxoglutarate ferredoxin oxidoreductase subunit delta
MAKKKVKGRITIDRELCKGCYLCISVCPQEVIKTSEKLNQKGYYPAKFLEDGDKGKTCIACTMCATMCPDVAIEVYRE